MKNNSSDFIKAKAYAFRLLRVRSRTENELKKRLLIKKFNSRVVEKVIDNLKEYNYINDRDYTRSLVNSKIKSGYGLRRIAFELKQKGIDQKTVDSIFNETPQIFTPSETIRTLALSRYHKLLKTTKDPTKNKRRIYGLLLRRGFMPDDILDIISKL